MAEEKKERVQEEVAESSVEEPSVEDQLLECQDKHLRLQADFDNFRKRLIKERSDLLRYGSEDLIVRLLDVLDNFDRAMASAHSTTDVTTMMQGIVLVQKQLLDVLCDKGVKKMLVQGETFDPNLHEAVTYEDDAKDVDDNTILEELQSGYQLHGKVIRFAKVKVAKHMNNDSNEGGE